MVDMKRHHHIFPLGISLFSPIIHRCSLSIMNIITLSQNSFSWYTISLLDLYVSFASCAQSCLTLRHPMDCSRPGSSVHGISPAKILEWVAISSSRGSLPPRDQTRMSCSYCIAGRFFTSKPLGFVSLGLPFLGISYEWDHIICDVCDWLLSLSVVLIKVHTCCSRCCSSPFFLCC